MILFGDADAGHGDLCAGVRIVPGGRSGLMISLFAVGRLGGRPAGGGSLAGAPGMRLLRGGPAAVAGRRADRWIGDPTMRMVLAGRIVQGARIGSLH